MDISRVNWREVEFVAFYTSKALTIDTCEIACEHAFVRGPPARPSHIVRACL